MVSKAFKWSKQNHQTKPPNNHCPLREEDGWCCARRSTEAVWSCGRVVGGSRKSIRHREGGDIWGREVDGDREIKRRR